MWESARRAETLDEEEAPIELHQNARRDQRGEAFQHKCATDDDQQDLLTPDNRDDGKCTAEGQRASVAHDELCPALAFRAWPTLPRGWPVEGQIAQRRA